MRYIAKQPFRIMLLTLFFAGMVTIAFFNLNLSTDRSVLTSAISAWINWLRDLSLSSSLNNIIAWGLLLLTSAGPLILLFAKRFRSLIQIILISSLTLLIAISQYLLINPWLILPNVQDFPAEVLPMLIRIFLLVILSLGLIVILYSLIAVKNDESTLITRFQGFLLVGLIAYVTAISISSVSQWQSLTDTPDASIRLWLFFIELLPALLLWIVAACVIWFLQTIKAGLFEPSNLKTLRKLKQLAHLSLTVSVCSLFAYNFLQLIALSQIGEMHFRVHVPIVELLILLIVLFLAMILEKSIPVHQENQTFV